MNSTDRDETADEAVDLEALAELGEGEGKTSSPGGAVGGFLWVLALCWSLFQLYIAYRPINSIIARSIHLTFAVLLVYLAYLTAELFSLSAILS